MMRLRQVPVCVTMGLAASVSPIAWAQQATPPLLEADSAYRAGLAAMAQKDMAAAQQDFEKVVRLAPAVERGHSALGAVLMARGRPREAIPEFEKAQSLQKSDHTSDPSVQMNLALAYQQTGSNSTAIPIFAALEASVRAQHSTLPARLLRAYARALTSAGDLKKAEVEMRAACDAEPGNAGMHDDLGSILAREENWPAAQQEFARAIALDAALASAHLHLGLALAAQGQDGSGQLDLAGQLAPGDLSIALEAGNALAAAGHDEQAIALFQRVLAQDPQASAAMYPLALALQRTNRVQEATELLRKVVSLEPRNAAALTNFGMALMQAQQNQDAVPILERALAADPRSVVAHQDLASAFVQLNQLDDAVKELEAARKLAPDSPQVHYDLGLALKMQDHPDAAIPEFEAAERLDPSGPEAPYALGTLYMQAAKYPEAAREIRRSLDLRPANGEGWATLGSVYNKLDRLPEAVDALREATRQLPDQPDPHLTLAAVLARQNQPQEAVLERRKAAELMHTHMNRQQAEVATNAGNGLLKSGDISGAAERFRDALAFDPTFAEAHLGLARTLEAQGKPVEAAAERAAATSK